MTTTINASPTNGIVQTADGSGVMKLQSNGVTTNALAWVNFAGASGTRNAKYNVSSVTRSSTGVYTVSFTTALSDANYAALITTTSGNVYGAATTLGTTSMVVDTRAGSTGTNYDANAVCVAIFGN
jgi:hypothetical protein